MKKKRPKTLPPIIYKDSWHSELAKLLTDTLKELIFNPLIETFENEIKQNAKDNALYAALKDGKINYTNGRFIGKFNASINKEIKALGGKYRRGEWILAQDKLPAMLVNLIELNRKKTERIYAALEQKLDAAKSKINSILKNLDLESLGVRGMDKVSVEFKKTVGKNLAVQPQLDQKGIRQIYTEYLKSTELPIKQRIWREYRDTTIDYTENFAQEEVERLRVDLKEIILSGAPRDYARTAINHHLGLSKARCKFIARQETALLTTEFKKALYCQTGITKYKWRTNHDHKVRKRHIELDGETIDWNDPPISSEKGQKVRRNHAGMDYNCFVGDTPISTIGIPIRSYNRLYSGQIIILDIGNIRIKSTPNHPILTLRGWVPAQFVNDADQIFYRFSSDKSIIFTKKVNDRSITIKKMHDFFAISYPTMRALGSEIQFHGDGICNQEINVITMDNSLLNKGDVIFPENISKNIFSFSHSPSSFFHRLSSQNTLFNWNNSTDSSSMTSFNLISSSDSIHTRPLKFFRGALVSNGNRIIFKNSLDSTSSDIEMDCNDIYAIARCIHGDDFLGIQNVINFITKKNSIFMEYSGDNLNTYSKLICDNFDAFMDFMGLNDLFGRDIFFLHGCYVPFVLKKVNKVSSENYNGEVYNLETESNIYIANDIIVSNCRCQALPIVGW